MVINGEKIMGYMLSFSVINQELVRTDDLYLVNKIQNYVQIEFTFDGKEWEDIDKYVIFTTKKKNYSIPLGNKMICNTKVPYQVLRHNKFYVSVFGGNRITTNEVKVVMDISGYTENIQPIDDDAPKDIFQVIQDRLNIKFDDMEYKNGNLICYSEGEIQKIVPLTNLEFQDYYTKDEVEKKLEQMLTDFRVEFTDDSVYLVTEKYKKG